MPFQSVPFTAEVSVNWLQNSQSCVMTFYGRKLSGYDQEDLENLAAAMDAWAVAEFRPLLSSQVTYNAIFVRGLQDIIDEEAQNSTGTGVGAGADEPLNNMSCFCVSRRTGNTGRSARGRVYFPIRNDMLSVNEDLLTAASADDITAALNEVRQSMIFAGFEEVIVSRYGSGVQRPVGLTIPVTGYLYTTLAIASQERRMPHK